jgi:hypothetical protein
LQKSIQSGVGVAHDPVFAAHHPEIGDGSPWTEEGWRATSTFVHTRCKSLLFAASFGTAWSDHSVEFSHRTAYDFVVSQRMQNILTAQIPAHFQCPDFEVGVGLVYAKELFLPGLANALEILTDALGTRRKRIKADGRDLLENAAARICDSTGKFWIRHHYNHMYSKAHITMPLAIQLVSYGYFEMSTEMIQQETSLLKTHVDVMRNPLRATLPRRLGGPFWESSISLVRLAGCQSAVPKATVDTCPVDVKAAKQVMWLPCNQSFWILLLLRVHKHIWDIEERRSIPHLIEAFLQSGASLDIEICIADVCRGPACLCTMPPVHLEMFECPSSKYHTHKWRSARNLLYNSKLLSQAEVNAMIACRDTSNDAAFKAELLDLATEMKAEWDALMAGVLRTKP